MSQIIDNILELICEMSTRRKIAEEKISSLSNQVIYHLIKILKWQDGLNYNKHCKDINTWMNKIQDISIDTKTGKFKSDQYYKFIFTEKVPRFDVLEKKIKYVLSDYKDLKEIRLDSEVYDILEKIIKDISNDLSNHNYTTIKHYLEKYA